MLSLIPRRQFLQLASGTVSLARAQSAAGPRPNVVVILADDQGWGDLSIHGNRNLSTPAIDSLGRDGARFDRFYVCPLCAPTRAEFLTGRYHPRGGVRGVTAGQERLNTDETTIAEIFRAAGYRTALFGKWHNGSQHPYHPNARGFEEFYGFTQGHWGHYFSPELEHNGNLVRGNGYLTDDFTDRAIEFIRRNRRNPFFCYLALNTPHSPMQVPGNFWLKFSEADLPLRGSRPDLEDLQMTRAALAMCENIDWNVGRLLSQLRQLGLEKDTIVVYFSDNGPNSWRWNGGMRGIKGSTEEGGVRSPLLVRWLAQIRPGTQIPQIAAAIDLLPTLTDLAGLTRPAGKPLDGVSLKPLLLGQAPHWPDRMIFSLQGKRVSVRTQRYCLDSEGRLYDMEADPGQSRDVASERPDVAAQLRAAQKQWASEMFSLLDTDDRPFPVGYARFTLLPARDGVPLGGVRRSSRHPNDSFFTNWRSAEDRIQWDVEVLHAGNYAADLYYTCPEADVGSTVEMSFAGQSVSAVIQPAHDPPLVGAQQDRVKRTESYVKDFRPLRLGTIRLPKTRAPLTLRAVEVKAGSVADVRYVALTRLD
ncbi:MAG: arylsulfatase [Bryobacteraceae bacterium]|nr:arylsulfatase [Bryobacteraceae bacterium]MDW8377830.1 arylsulfatase [Bryobacterales bacterium]